MNLWAFTYRNARGLADGLRGELRTLRGWGSRSADFAAIQATGPLAVHFAIERAENGDELDGWASGVVQTVHWALDAELALVEWACGVSDRSLDGPPEQSRAARALLDMVAGWARGSVERGTLSMVREAHLDDVRRWERAGTLRGAAAALRLAVCDQASVPWQQALDGVILARAARRGDRDQMEAMRAEDSRELLRILEEHRTKRQAATAASDGGAA